MTNIYRIASNLFIDGTSILSREGTTQGDPLAMPMYAISLIPVIQRLRGIAKQVWYADDAAAGGSLRQLKKWWDTLCSFSGSFGYNVNAVKCWLVVKEGLLQRANHVFMGTGVQVTSSGRPYLGAALGSTTFIDSFTEQRVDEWIQGVSRLSSFAETQPHASYAAFAHGYLSKWNYFFRTTPNISNRLSPLESAVRSHFLPKLVLHPVGDVERELFGLPVRFGGLGISNPTLTSDEQYTFSRELLHGLIDLIYHQNPALSEDVVHHQHEIFRHLSSVKERSLSNQLQSTLSSCPPPLRWAVECCTEKGSSSWLTALPLEQYGFALHKGEFIDAICLRYGYMPSRLPSHCVCGKDFSLSHALSCPHGAFPIIRHNEIRNLTASLMSEVCHNVQIEPQLHPLSGETLHYRSAIQDDDARVDIRASGFWRCLHHHTFFDVRVFNCFATSNRSSMLSTAFRKHELEKRRAYEERIREVEHGSFTPLVFSTSGGMGRAATTTYKHLARLLSEKWNSPYSVVMGWLRCSLGFSLLRSSVMCIRGSRSRSKCPCVPPAVDLAVAEGHLPAH